MGAGLTSIKTFYTGKEGSRVPLVYASGWMITYPYSVKMAIWELNSAASDTCTSSTDFISSYTVSSTYSTHDYTNGECGTANDGPYCEGWHFSDFTLGDQALSKPLIMAIDNTIEMVNQPSNPVHIQYIWTFLVSNKTSNANEHVGRTKLTYPADSTQYEMRTIDYYGSNSDNLDAFIIQLGQIQNPDLASMGHDRIALVILDTTREDGATEFNVREQFKMSLYEAELGNVKRIVTDVKVYLNPSNDRYSVAFTHNSKRLPYKKTATASI